MDSERDAHEASGTVRGNPRDGDRLLRALLLRDPARLGLMAGTALVATAAGLLLPGALAAAVDAAISGQRSWPQVLWLLTLGVSEILAEVLGIVITARVTTSGAAWLRHRLSGHLVRLGLNSPFAKGAEGDAISRITGDSTGAAAVPSLVVQLGSALVLSGGAIVLLALLDWRLAVVFLVSVPVALLLARSHLRLTADDVTTYQEVSGELSARLLDAVAGLRTIAASGTADREAERVLRPLPLLGAAGIGMWRTQARMVWRAGLLLPSVQLAVLVAAGFGVLYGRLSVGDVLAALGYTMLGMGLVGQIALLTALSKARSCATRITAVLELPTPRRGTFRLPEGPGTVEARGVCVPGVLHDIDLAVPGGSWLAVVGPSGAGKSTLVSVLGGLREPDRGEVLLDGVPLYRLPAEEVRAAIGHAFERPALLGATVRDSVAYGSWAGLRAVERACRAAQVHDLVVRLPEGYDTPLTETPLSGGEAQRLGLARALARAPRVLALDEATGSLDTVTEARVEAAIAGLLPGRTRLAVTHRATTARRADLVLWLDHGRVRGLAPHSELWQDPGYRDVFTEGANGEG